MDSSDVARQHAGIAESRECTRMDSTDGNDDPMTQCIRRGFAIVFQRELGRHSCIMPVNPKKDADHNRCKDQDNPGTVTEFCNCKNKHDDRRAKGAKPIADHLEKPASFITQYMPVFL